MRMREGDLESLIEGLRAPAASEGSTAATDLVASTNTKQGHWASAEGQADYFASNDCLKNILLNSKILKLSKEPVTDFIKEKCSAIFQSQERLEVCYQSSIVITKVAAFLSRLGGRRGRRLPKPSIMKRDQSTAYSTIYKYPSRQCRVDTFFEGALCSEYFYGEASNCPSSSEAYQGARPKCWLGITSE